MQADSDRQCERARQRRRFTFLSRKREGKADSHSFRQIVQRNGKHKHCGAPQTGRKPLRLIAAGMQMGQQPVERLQKNCADQESSGGRQPAGRASFLGHLNRRHEQRPDRRRNHYAGSKAKKNLLKRSLDFTAKEEYHCGAESCHQTSKACPGQGRKSGMHYTHSIHLFRRFAPA